MIERILDVARRLLEKHQPRVVALDGPIGAGKSTLAAALAAATPACVIPSDDFFAAEITAAGWDARSPAERARDAIDWRRLRQCTLEPLRAGQRAVWRPFDFAAGERADGTYPMAEYELRVDPAPLIILEGAYSSRPELADLLDLTVLVDTPLPIRLARIAKRDSPDFLEAWHQRWDDAEAYYFRTVRPWTSFDLVLDTQTGNTRSFDDKNAGNRQTADRRVPQR